MQMKLLIFIVSFIFSNLVLGQKTAIAFELNGKPSNLQIQDSIDLSKNPFAKFIGEWTLKNDTWIQNWGDQTDTIKIPGHHTISSQINTDHSLLSIIDGPEPNGHIFWSYNPNTKAISHLSGFGSIRVGVGEGTFFKENNLRLKVSFEGEAEGTYRIYTYEWISEHEYALHSVQFDKDDQPTGLFYQGNFVRINTVDKLEKEIKAILAVLDNNEISKEEQLRVYSDDIIHMAPDHEAITNKKDLLIYLNQQKEFGQADMEHQIIEYSQHEAIVILRGQVVGDFYPSDGSARVPFRTKNLFVFKRVNGVLKIWKVIYNKTE